MSPLVEMSSFPLNSLADSRVYSLVFFLITAMFTIQYRRPYSGELTIQSFTSFDAAIRMINFIESCGTRVTMLPVS